MDESYKLGIDGETLAAEYLTKQGYEIIEQRWHDHHMEIDILAIDPETNELVSVEVKTRSTTDWGDPESAVDYRKIMRCVHATDFYIKLHQIQNPWRFDIISIVFNKDGSHTLEQIKSAFYPPLG